MALWMEGLEEGHRPLLALMPDPLVSPFLPLPLSCWVWCWSSKGVHLSSCVGSLRGTAWGCSSFFHLLNPCWFLQPELLGIYVPGTGTLG